MALAMSSTTKAKIAAAALTAAQRNERLVLGESHSRWRLRLAHQIFPDATA